MKAKRDQQLFFQLSGIDNEDNYKNFEIIFSNFNLKFDSQKNYNPDSTHLIVETLNATEKVLCFIASGKPIVRQSFVKDSLERGMWLNEKGYHISEKHEDSKLSQASLKWMRKIQNEKLYPFTSWRIISFMNDANWILALKNIVNAGKGEIQCISDFIDNKVLLRAIDRCTLVVYCDIGREVAEQFASLYNKPCYPFHAIPDYLIIGEYSIKPMFSTTFYSKVPPSLKSLKNQEDDINSGKPNKELSFIYKYGVYSMISKNPKQYKFADQYFTQLFDINWQNSSYIEALSLLNALQSNDIPKIKQLTYMLEFLYKKNKLPQQVFTTNVQQTNDYIYNMIYFYFINLMCNNPPTIKPLIDFYKKLFNHLDFFTCSAKDDFDEVKSLIDILYLISIHDYLLLTHGDLNVKMSDCLLIRMNINTSYVIGLFNVIVKFQDNLRIKLIYKLLQIISLLNEYAKNDTAYRPEKLVDIRKLIDIQNAHK